MTAVLKTVEFKSLLLVKELTILKLQRKIILKFNHINKGIRTC